MTEYQKFLRNNNIDQFGLLGNYNKDDVYVIPREIIDELIKINKKVVSYKQEGIKCEASLEDITLKFVIKFYVGEKKDIKYSSLYLLEEYENLNKKVSLETFLVNFHDTDDSFYFDKLKKVFNLYTKDESEGKDIKNSSSSLIKIIKEKKSFAKKLINEIAIEDRKYIIDVIKILKQSGEYGVFIQRLLKDEMSKIKHNKTSTAYWVELKGKLDMILFEHYDKCPEETKKWLELVNQNYVLIYMNKEKKLKNNTKENTKSAEKKKAPKAKAKDKSKKSSKNTKKVEKKQKENKKESSSTKTEEQKVIANKIENKTPVKGKSKVFDTIKKNDISLKMEYKDFLNNFDKISINQLGGVFNDISYSPFSNFDFNIEIKEADQVELKDSQKTHKEQENGQEIIM